MEQLRENLLVEEGSEVLHMDSVEVDVSYPELLRGSEAIVVAEVGDPFTRRPESELFEEATSTDTTIVLQTALVTEVVRSPEGSVLAPGREVTLVLGTVNPDNQLVRDGHVVLPYGSTGVVPTGSHALLMNRLTPGVASAYLRDVSEIGYTLVASYNPMVFLKVSGNSLSVADDRLILPPSNAEPQPLDEEAATNLKALNPDRTFETPGSLEELRELAETTPFDSTYDIPAEG